MPRKNARPAEQKRRERLKEKLSKPKKRDPWAPTRPAVSRYEHARPYDPFKSFMAEVCSVLDSFENKPKR